MFRQGLAGQLPLTVVTDPNQAQVVFRFRPVGTDKRVELSVSLNDNQQLWSVTQSVLASQIAPTPQCAAANRLIEQLRAAMRSARDGIWYQPLSDPLPEPGAKAASDELARLEKELQNVIESRSQPPKIETRYDVSGGAYQVIEANRVFWRFSWKMTVKNYGPDTIVVSPTIEFKNRNGLIVDTGIGDMRTISAQDSAEITGTSLINAGVAPSVTDVVVRAKRIR